MNTATIGNWHVLLHALVQRLWPRALAALGMALCVALLGACDGGGDAGPAPASITVQPSSSSVVAGAAATFTVTASGDGLSYQWQRSTDNGTTWVDLAGATSASYTVASPAATLSGQQFRVIVSAAGNSVTSSPVTLTVAPAPTAPQISVQPADQAALAGATVSFSVTASGTGLAYQWQSSSDGSTWANVGGATATTLNLSAVAVADNGKRWRVVVSNGAGSVTSSAAVLTVNVPLPPPVITTQPANASVQAPQSAVFTVVASGAPEPSYQWQSSSDGGASFADLAGATAASYTTPATTVADDGKRYRVKVSNSQGVVTSAAAQLSVSAAAVAPTITAQPADQTVTEPATATFAVTADGTPTPTYQWQISTDGGATFSNINGATAARYTTAATAAADSGKRLRVQVSNSAGHVTSNPATLTVNAAGGGGGGGGGSGAGPCGFQGAASTGFTATVVSTSLVDAAQTSTLTLRVNGPATFQGQQATEVQSDLVDNALGNTTTLKSYGTFDTTSGAFTAFGSTSHGAATIANFTTITDTTNVYTPAFVDRTYALRVGESVTQTSTQAITRVVTLNGVVGTPTTQTDTSTSTTQLVALESVTVPAGTFNTCRFLITKQGETGGVTLWVLQNLGLQVKFEGGGATSSAVSITVNGTPLR